MVLTYALMTIKRNVSGYGRILHLNPAALPNCPRMIGSRGRCHLHASCLEKTSFLFHPLLLWLWKNFCRSMDSLEPLLLPSARVTRRGMDGSCLYSLRPCQRRGNQNETARCGSRVAANAVFGVLEVFTVIHPDCVTKKHNNYQLPTNQAMGSYAASPATTMAFQPKLL